MNQPISKPNTDKEDAEIAAFVSGVLTARKAIIDDLTRRLSANDHTVQWIHRAESGGLLNFASGTGEMDCPVCKTAKLRYARSAYNSHIHAACRNDQCVRWME